MYVVCHFLIVYGLIKELKIKEKIKIMDERLNCPCDLIWWESHYLSSLRSCHLFYLASLSLSHMVLVRISRGVRKSGIVTGATRRGQLLPLGAIAADQASTAGFLRRRAAATDWARHGLRPSAAEHGATRCIAAGSERAWWADLSHFIQTRIDECTTGPGSRRWACPRVSTSRISRYNDFNLSPISLSFNSAKPI